MAGSSSQQEAKQRFIGELPGRSLALAHAIFVYAAFFGSLAIGWNIHYYKLVKNSDFGYPDEWFPSISATIGDWWNERSFFQYLMAAASGPRFSIVIMSFWLLRQDCNQGRLSHTFNRFILIMGIFRTLMAGGWTYITSNDDHFWHDVAMISYLVSSFLYHVTYAYATYLARKPLSDGDWSIVRSKILFSSLYLLDIVPLVYFFIEHKVNHVPGAYSYYALTEWALVFFDVGYDATAMMEFSTVSLVLVDRAPERKVDALRDGSIAPADKIDPLLLQNNFIAAKEFIVDTYLAFLSWSLFTSVGTMIWYFPLFNMSLSGEEATIISSLSPIVLSIPGLLILVQNTQAIVHLLSLIGIACYLVPAPSSRLLLGGVGLAINMLVVVATWYQSPARRDRAAVTFLLGLLVSVIVRVWTVTTNPIWPIMNETNGGMQVPALILALVCIIDVFFRASPPTTVFPKKTGNVVAAGLGFGAVIFVTHLFFTETATLSRFIWTGFPDHGPEPFPHGLLVLVAMFAGLILSTVPAVSKSPFWWAAAALGCSLLYYAEGWVAFSGGLLLGVYVMSVWPLMISAVSQHPPILSLGIGLLLDILLFFGHAWVVAYAFVPYGELMREHTEYLLIVVMVSLLIGIVAGGGDALFQTPKQEPSSSSSKSKDKQSAQQATDTLVKTFFSQEFVRLLAAVLILILLTAAAASTRIHPEPAYKVRGQPTEKVVTAGIWTIHFGYDNEMWASHDRMAAFINDSTVDFIGLLESDTTRMFIGNRDVPLMIAEKLNLYLDYGPRSRDHTWGCALLSKFPIKWSKHYLLPSPQGELACAIHATLDIAGDELDVLVVHNGQEETPLDRELQTKMEAEIIRNSTNPLVFIGYVVTKPHADQYKWLVDGGGAKDIDPSDYDRWCEYIVYKGLEKIGYARISHGGITDTEMQIGRFRMNTNTDNVDEIPAKDVPKNYRFPRKFDGKGIRGHRYHVFDRPKYFGKKTTTNNNA